MSVEQNFPQVGGPVLDPRGNFSQEWLAFFRALWNRTGEGPGTDPAQLVIPSLVALSGSAAVNNAQDAAEAAQLLALARPQFKASLDEAKLFALSLARPPAAPGSHLEVDDEGAPVDTAAAVLNFTGSGVTATQTSPGVVQVDVPGASMSSYVPMATGSEPLTFMSNGSGQPMLIPYTP